jgi:hypothetical protein
MRRNGYRHNVIPEHTSIHNPLAAVGHPFIQWYKAGHQFALCSDNPGLLQCPLSEVYRYAAEALVASRFDAYERERLDFENDSKLMDEVGKTAWRLAMSAIPCTFASAETKQRLRRELLEHPWCN